MATGTKEKVVLTYKGMKRGLEIIFLILMLLILLLLLRSCGEEPKKNTVLEPDYAVIPVDDQAKPMESSDPVKEPVVQQSGGSVTISFQDNISYDTTTGWLTLFYQNPASSTHNVTVEVILLNGGEEYLLARSGLLEPGYEVSTLRIDQAAPTVSAGGYNAKLRLAFYDRETGERANVDTDIPCTVTVK